MAPGSPHTHHTHATRRPHVAAVTDCLADAGGGAGPPAAKKSLSERAVLGLWTQLQADGAKKPLPRYEQAAALAGDTIYVVGGNYGERARMGARAI